MFLSFGGRNNRFFLFFRDKIDKYLRPPSQITLALNLIEVKTFGKNGVPLSRRGDE